MRICFLVSGGGGTMAAILEAIRIREVPDAWPALIIASRPGISALEKARAAGIPEKDIVIISPKKSFQDFGEEILLACREREVNFVGQYGWLPRTPPFVIDEYPDMMVNQHPGPLNPESPGYDFGGQGMFGLRVSAARLCFVKKTGRQFYTEATAQRVHRNFDQGEVLGVERVEIYPESDTPEAIQKRLLAAEHRVQIGVLNDFTQRRVRALVRPAYSFVRPEEKVLLERCKAQAISDYRQR
jgi:phosphoribosylglycinamide formyltransferase-1